MSADYNTYVEHYHANKYLITQVRKKYQKHNIALDVATEEVNAQQDDVDGICDEPGFETKNIQ